MAIIDIIKYDGNPDGSQWLIYKYPSERFVLGSQLIVNQGQEALFFRGGEALDLFGPGTHTLSTGNLPILNKLVNYPFGGKTPFSAEIYYINKTAALDLKWGTSTPIPLEDPKYGVILNVGSRGQYGIFINDSRLFVSRIIGAIPSGKEINQTMICRYYNSFINTKIKSVTAEYMIKKQISFLEISLYLSELSNAFKDVLCVEFDRFGIEIINFYCDSISPKDGEIDKLQKYKERELGKNLEVYEPEQIITCHKCNAQNPISMKFCGKCGYELVYDVICPHCSSPISVGMRFCGLCGNALPTKCSSCGFENQANMKFCGICGHKL